MSRSDAAAKVAGSLTFGTDLHQTGMAWAALVPSPVAHGRIRSLDLEPVRRAPGVVAVIGAAEARALLPHGGSANRPLFPSEEVIYRHQPVAAVAARSLAEARVAASRVRLEIEPLQVRSDLDSIFPEWPGSELEEGELINAHVRARWGDPESAFARADHVRRDEFRTNGVAQVPLEPHACLAEVKGGRWYVASSTQSPFSVREDTAELLHLPMDSVVVDGSWVGGGFGGKAGAFLEPYALVLSALAEAPVRLALTYREEFLLTRSTLPARFWIESAVQDGRLSARRVRMMLDTGASLPGRDFATGYAIAFLLGPYRLASFDMEGYAVRTHKPPFGAHRAPIVPQCVFAIDGHTDALARELGLDPIEFRAAHLWQEGDETPMGQRVGPFGADAALARIRALRDRWRVEMPPGTGFGVGLGYWSTGTGAGGEARVTIAPTEVVIHEGEREIGSGSVIRGLAAVAERVLDLPASAIRVEYADTSRGPYDSGVYGSRTLGALGRAVEEASRTLLRELSRRMGGASVTGLSLRGGTIRVRSDAGERPVLELLTPEERTAGGLTAKGRHYGRGAEIDPRRVVRGDFFGHTDFTASVHLAAVRVDRETGQVTVVRYAAAQDAGTVVDGPTWRAQVEGGVAMGLGTALTEEMLWGPDGSLANPGLLDYRIPTLKEIPPIEVIPIEGFLGAGPFGAKGIGEPPIIPVPAAVANAVADATGARLTELPLTPERVARALAIL